MRVKLLAVMAGVMAAMVGSPVASGPAAGGTEVARSQQVVSTVASGVTTWAVQWGRERDVPVPADYIGDSRTELAVYRPTTGTWWIRGMKPVVWGNEWGRPVPADYDGDGKAEIAVYNDGMWFIRGVGTFQWGRPGDWPVPANYVGDRRTDLAVIRPASTPQRDFEPYTWFVKGAKPVSWGGQPSAEVPRDVPVPADYVGDSHADIAVMRIGEDREAWPVMPWPNTWYIRGMTPVTWGYGLNINSVVDRPHPADFIGDRHADITTWRQDGRWYIRGLGRSILWGRPPEAGNVNDTAVLGDYGGDSHTDIAVWRHATGTWYIRVESPLR